jgi:hypothetical protein
MRDFDPAQLVRAHTVPRWLREGVEMKDSCKELGGKKEDGSKAIATHEQRCNESPGGIYFFFDRRQCRRTRTEGLNGGCELIQFTFGTGKCGGGYIT